MYAKLISLAIAGLIALPLIGCETSGQKPDDMTGKEGTSTAGTASGLVAGSTGSSATGTGQSSTDSMATGNTGSSAMGAGDRVTTAAKAEGSVYRDSEGNEVYLFSGTPTADDLLAQLTSDQKTRQIVFIDQVSQPQVEPACASQFESGKTLGLNITFPVNSASLTAEAKQQLNSVAELLQRYDCLEFTISGHTDTSGNPGINKPLSERRAQAVRDYLVQEEGIAADRFSTAGYGSERLLQGLPETDPKHRRVEFSVS